MQRNIPLCSTITLNNPIGANSTMKTFLNTPNPTPISPKPVTTIIPSATIILGSGSNIVSVY
jgi:hypothetical protein